MSSAYWQFNALMRKNMLILKRNLAFSIFEIMFPILIILVICLISLAFKRHTYHFEEEEKNMDTFLKSKSAAYVNKGYLSSSSGNEYYMDSYTNELLDNPTDDQKLNSIVLHNWNGLGIRPILNICYERKIIAIIGKNFPEDLLDKLKENFAVTDPYLSTTMNYKKYDSIDEMEKIVKDKDYGIKDSMPKICFGIYFEEKGENNYEYSLHYFGEELQTGIQDIPDTGVNYYNEFQQWPDLKEYQKHLKNGYGYIMKIINDYIYFKSQSESTNKDDVYIDYAMMMQKYDTRKENDFAEKITTLMPICVVIAYICPLIMFTLKMVGDKENKTKEGMKIMGLSEWIYFLSYFVWYFVENILYSIIHALIHLIVLPHIPFVYLFLFFFFFGLDVFAMGYFFQSFIDKTRIALILSLIIFFVMYFLVCMVGNRSTSHVLKMVSSICPPVVVQHGFMIFAEFEITYKDFEYKYTGQDIYEYTLNAVYYMMAADVVIYLFLGFYLQNIVSHDFGISRPFYFLCTKSYWCGNSSNKNNQNKDKIFSEGNEDDLIYENPYAGNPDFQDESLYKEKPKSDIYHIHKLMKKFSDGKLAVNNVTFSLYKDEIFALLGHNGAGKTTIISMLTGLYEATSGSAYYNGDNVLDNNNMDLFRQKLGICPQHDVLFDDLTVSEHLSLFCYFKGVNKENIPGEIEKTLKEFRIIDIEDIVVKNLSAGQRRKLSIAISVIGGSEVIFLDEPSSGMDITGRRNLWEILKRITERKIIILTTHFMEEASVLGKRIGIISNGVMKCIGTPLFLIDRFGKYITITILKEQDANNESIIEFFKKWSPTVEYEVLSEEILFRIIKDNNEDGSNKFDIKAFFEDLDKNTKELKIKSYSASMPTLEDVFLNVAKQEKNEKENEKEKKENGSCNCGCKEDNQPQNEVKISEDENDKILFEEKYQSDYSPNKKFWMDILTLIIKRGRQIYRDTKTFCLEILCPLLLIVIGLSFCQAKPFYEPKSYSPNFEDLDSDIHIYIGSSNDNPINDNLINLFEGDKSAGDVNIKVDKILLDNSYTSSNQNEAIKEFMNKVFEKNDEHSYGNILILKDTEGSSSSTHFQFIELLDAKVRQGPIFYNQYFLTKIINYLTGKDIKIKYQNKAFPFTKEAKDDNKQLNYLLMVFFVVVAFSLMPANFITNIIKEKVNNSKHLMKTSGVSLFSYWLANYIFELLKYYIIGGISLLIIWAFDAYAEYLYILYILYGPAVVAFTYLLSYSFSTEFKAQIGIIVANCLIGALLSALIMLLRTEESLADIAEIIAYFLRLIPSFSFGYGYNLLINKVLVLMADDPFTYTDKINNEKNIMIKMKYMGSDVLMLTLEFVVYLTLMIIIEWKQNTFEVVEDKQLKTDDVNDSLVLEEIKKANLKDGESLELKQEKNESEEDNNPPQLPMNENYPQENKKETSPENPNSIPSNENNIQNKVNNVYICQDASSQLSNKNIPEQKQIGNYLNKEDQDKPTEQKNNSNKEQPKYAIKIKNLKKTYLKGNSCSNEEIEAIKNLSLCVEYGECFGLLGLNGAGKTTTFKCLTKEISANNGSIYINDKNIATNFEDVRHMFGYCPQFDAIFEYMTVEENLSFYAKIKGIKKEKIDKMIKAMLNAMSLTEYKKKISGNLSGGNKRKLSVAISMICNPPIILLDEPSTGMDPEARRFMWAVIHKISTKKKNSSVIMTTHSMEEAETLCKRMGIMVNGEFVCLGSSNRIKEKYGFGYEINVHIMPLHKNEIEDLLKQKEMNISIKVTKDNLNDILTKLDKLNYFDEINPERLGKNILAGLTFNGAIKIEELINWIHYVNNSMKVISHIIEYFNEIILTEFIENNFLFKIKREKDSKSIGFLFGTIESCKDECRITEYSIQQTSLEQIFNRFAANQNTVEKEKNKDKDNSKIEIEITKDLLGKLV